MRTYEQLFNLFTEHLSAFRGELDKQTPPELYGPAVYITGLGGKRLRPVLALMACEALGGDVKRALDSALAVELFHNFSLIHDDILDNAPLRRNQATVHTKWNQNIAILSGDALLVKSLQVLGQYPAEELKSLSGLLINTALLVCEGQQLDMNFETLQNVSINEYLRMIRLKTAVLLGCSLQMGAINAGSDLIQQTHLFHFGENIGIAFQLMDDYLDAFADDPEKFGKQTGGDIMARKKTFLLLKALELASPDERKEINRLMQSPERNAKEHVSRMLDLFRQLKVDEHCKRETERFTNLALEALNNLQASPENKLRLHGFATELMNRQT
ncbi:MAG TPA: polyprenyl synthetase family protein [Bacteroidia bacterium]|nr:polyprenyl synthetase family protein [Bacteroidia bacterium]